MYFQEIIYTKQAQTMNQGSYTRICKTALSWILYLHLEYTYVKKHNNKSYWLDEGIDIAPVFFVLAMVMKLLTG